MHFYAFALAATIVVVALACLNHILNPFRILFILENLKHEHKTVRKITCVVYGIIICELNVPSVDVCVHGFAYIFTY